MTSKPVGQCLSNWWAGFAIDLVGSRLDLRHRRLEFGGERSNIEARLGDESNMRLPGREFGDRPACDHSSVVQHDDPVRDLFDVVEPMGGEKNRGSLAGTRTNEIKHRLSTLAVECSGRFVQEHHVVPTAEGESEREALLLTARHSAPSALCLVCQPAGAEQACGIQFRTVQTGEQFDGLRDGETHGEAAALWHNAPTVCQGGTIAVRVESEDADAAARGFVVPLDGFDRRGLSGTVRSEEGNHFAWFDAKGGAVDDDGRIESDGELLHVDRTHIAIVVGTLSSLPTLCLEGEPIVIGHTVEVNENENRPDLARMRRDYSEQGFDEASAAADPFVQFDQWLAQAVAAELDEPNAMVVSTVDAHGAPWARHLLLKGLSENASAQRGFEFYTNYASNKGAHLDLEPRVALTFPWLGLHRQVCITGMATRLAPSESDAYFGVRPRTAQLGAWASEQSAEISTREVLDERMIALDREFGDVVERPPHWGGYRVIPTTIEFWQGRPSRLHDRLRYERDPAGAWTMVRLSP